MLESARPRRSVVVELAKKGFVLLNLRWCGVRGVGGGDRGGIKGQNIQGEQMYHRAKYQNSKNENKVDWNVECFVVAMSRTTPQLMYYTPQCFYYSFHL